LNKISGSLGAYIQGGAGRDTFLLKAYCLRESSGKTIFDEKGRELPRGERRVDSDTATAIRTVSAVLQAWKKSISEDNRAGQIRNEINPTLTQKILNEFHFSYRGKHRDVKGVR
jgi:hypothetical protein